MEEKKQEQVKIELPGNIRADVTGRWPIVAGIIGGLIAWLAYLVSLSV